MNVSPKGQNLFVPIQTQYCRIELQPPELHKIRYSEDGKTIQAIEFHKPGVPANSTNICHVKFRNVAVYLVTLEKAFDQQLIVDWHNHKTRAAIARVEKSEWLRSYPSLPSQKFQHLQLLFRQAVLDIICESFEEKKGTFYGF